MEWLASIKSVIQYIEENIETIKSVEEVANHHYISSLYLQQGFQVMTGYSISEYIKGRRLYLAAKELANTNVKVIDVALKYGYENNESFTKAFKRFHGFAPSKTKENFHNIHKFEPLAINISISGGNVTNMDYKIANLFPMKIIGFVKEFDFENSYQEIPKFWDEICEKYCNNIYAGNAPSNEYEQAIVDNCIGEFAVCIDTKNCQKFKYLVGGRYTGGKVPEGMMVYEFPQGEWAIFDCYGPNPETLQKTNTRIFKEWLPLNKDFEIRGEATIEWYDCINGNMTDSNYHSAIWIPVKRIK